MVKKNGDFDIKGLIKKIETKKKRIPLLLAKEAKNHFVSGFRTGGGKTDASRGGWKQRGFPLKKNKGRAILTQNGDLRRSIQVRQKQFDRIVIGTSGIPYADIHNLGGRIPITPKMRKFFYAMMLLAGSQGKGDSMRLNSSSANEARFWRGMVRHKGNTLTIPQREFIGKSILLERKMLVILRRELLK